MSVIGDTGLFGDSVIWDCLACLERVAGCALCSFFREEEEGDRRREESITWVGGFR